MAFSGSKTKERFELFHSRRNPLILHILLDFAGNFNSDKVGPKQIIERFAADLILEGPHHLHKSDNQ